MKSILTENQIKLLDKLSSENQITQNFYHSGGTALAEFYLLHRLSEDLNFFCFEEFDAQGFSVLIKKISKELGIERIDFQQSFNRNLFFIHFPNDVIKTEFTHYPFEQIEEGKKYHNLRIDSLLDIATNKLFTIYQNPRSRDFIDLYLILKKENWTIEDLIKKAKVKFDWHIDPLQLGAQFTQVTEVKDYPRMVIELKERDWQDFFIDEAKKLGKKVLK